MQGGVRPWGPGYSGHVQLMTFHHGRLHTRRPAQTYEEVNRLFRYLFSQLVTPAVILREIGFRTYC